MINQNLVPKPVFSFYLNRYAACNWCPGLSSASSSTGTLTATGAQACLQLMPQQVHCLQLVHPVLSFYLKFSTGTLKETGAKTCLQLLPKQVRCLQLVPKPVFSFYLNRYAASNYCPNLSSASTSTCTLSATGAKTCLQLLPQQVRCLQLVPNPAFSFFLNRYAASNWCPSLSSASSSTGTLPATGAKPVFSIYLNRYAPCN